MRRDGIAAFVGLRKYSAVRHTVCRFCNLDIEGFAPYRKGEWRDRGNNTTCPQRLKGLPHAPETRETRE